MGNKLARIFGRCCDTQETWWIIVLFFLFLAFQDCWKEIDISSWIPFLILLLIVCSCNELEDECGC